LIFIAPDIDLGPRDSIFVPFFGIQTNTITSVSRLARLSGAEVCLMTTTLNPDRKTYTCNISAPLPSSATDDVEADTAHLNKYIEDLVRERPTEYYWIHKRLNIGRLENLVSTTNWNSFEYEFKQAHT
jgi:KDO2-lipid IV(A) lauroyltransferase